jgi:hypothetical protein
MTDRTLDVRPMVRERETCAGAVGSDAIFFDEALPTKFRFPRGANGRALLNSPG